MISKVSDKNDDKKSLFYGFNIDLPPKWWKAL
jgi:hypothetical protein